MVTQTTTTGADPQLCLRIAWLQYCIHLGGAASSFVEVQVSSPLGRLAVFAGAFTSLQFEPHRFLKRRQLWRCLMQCSFGTSPGSNDEAVCLVYSVESHVPEKDDARNVDIRIVRASNASEPSLQAMERADWGFNYPTKSWPQPTIAFTPIPVPSCHRGHLAEAAELRRGLHAQAIHEHPSTP